MNVFDLPVHPAAEVFPMLDDDELSELAADIKANGLQHPLVVADLNGSTVLVDGRNRREACRIAGVDPTTTTLDGDPVAFIISENIKRRHLTKGQRAMAEAKIRPSQQGKKTSSKKEEVSAAHISRARAVLQFAPDIADNVLNGSIALADAYATAQQRKQAAEGPQIRLAALRKHDPDLADRVVEGDLQLADAEAASRERRQRERAERQAIYDTISDLKQSFDLISTAASRATLIDLLRNHSTEIDADATAQLFVSWRDALSVVLKEMKA